MSRLKITKAMARHAADRLAEHFHVTPDTFDIYEPGFHSSNWSIASETAPYEWTIEASEALNGDFSGRVFYEPVNHWRLGLYPA